MKKIIEKIRVYILAVVLVIVDQISKLIALKNLTGTSQIIIKNFLKFTYCENKGVAFSLGSGNVALFIIINIILITGIIIYFEKNREKFNKLGQILIAMTIAGGVSNLIDRVFRGYVIDFIDINDWFSFAIFNVADIFITTGIFGLAIVFVYKGIKEKN